MEKGEQTTIRKIEISEDLYLKQFELSDTMDLYAIVEQQRESINLCWVPSLTPTADFGNGRKYIFDPAKVLANFNSEFEFVIVYQEKIIGLAGFKNYNLVNRTAHLGCFISKELYGRGLAISALKTLMDFACDELKINKLQVKCPLGNLIVSYIPRRLGFRIEGVERAGEMSNGKAIDLEVYGMLRDDYLRIRSEGSLYDSIS